MNHQTYFCLLELMKLGVCLNCNTYTFSNIQGGLYALVAAHLAQLILNWHSDAFALRQRLNFFGNWCTKTRPQRPEAMPLGNMQRIARLVFAALTLCVALKFETGEDGVSHVTHAFGALFGLLSGCVFLRVRSSKRAIRIIQNILLVLICGFTILSIFGYYMTASDEQWCPWKEYETRCQEHCYVNPSECHWKSWKKCGNETSTENPCINKTTVAH